MLACETTGQQQSSDLVAPMKLLANKTKSNEVRAEQAEKLYRACKEHIRKGERAEVIALLDPLIGLLDDKAGWVVYWVSMSIGVMGKDGHKALPKLVELLNNIPETMGKSRRSGIELAIKRITTE